MHSHLWVISFQHTDRGSVRTRCTCVEAVSIRDAIDAAEKRIRKYMGEALGVEKAIITDCGIAGEGFDAGLYGEVWADPVLEPDRELFRWISEI